MAVRSERFCDPTVVDAVGVVLFTVPPQRRYIVKTMRACNIAGADALLSVCLNTVEPASALLWQSPVNWPGVFGDVSWWCMNAGDSLIALSDPADALTITVSGTALVLLP